MQKIINVMALLSFGVSTAAVIGGIYVYNSRAVILEEVREKVVEELSAALPGIVGGLMPDVPEMPSATGGVIPSKTGPAIPFK
jgi:hypothetical protein|tara:strand:+ start:410 stop:658 length:249 start_codon:yes stop_codon:yes gene_type:complete